MSLACSRSLTDEQRQKIQIGLVFQSFFDLGTILIATNRDDGGSLEMPLVLMLTAAAPLAAVPSPVDCTTEQIAVPLVAATSPMGRTEEELTAADITEKECNK